MLGLLGLVDSIHHTFWPDPHYILQTDPSHINQKPTYHVQSSSRMRMLRLKILQRYLVLKEPSVWMTTLILSRQSYLTHLHLPNSHVSTCSWVLLGFIGFQTLASAHALCLPTNSVRIFTMGSNFQTLGLHLRLAFAEGSVEGWRS